MDHSLPRRPRVSRETRLLLSTVFLAIAALWILARVRFPDQSAAATPVQPLLTQLGGRATFDDLASEIAQLHPRVEPMLVGSALRIRNDAAVRLLDQPYLATPAAPHEEIIGFDLATRLAVVRAPFLPAPPPVPWTPSDPQRPRYLIASDVSTGALALRPVLVSSLVATLSPLWPEPIWLLPAGTELAPGSFVFTMDALLAGLVIDLAGRTAILPGTVLLAEANRLLVPTVSLPGEFGVEVQALTPSVAKATGAATGVVVAWVDPKGPSAGSLAVGDVLEDANGEPLMTPLHWEARAARVSAGKAMTVRVRRGGNVSDVALMAAPALAGSASPSLGLTLRSVPGTGSVVTEVDSGSAADRAGLRAGDIITLVGDVKTPSPAAVRRTFDRASAGGAVLVAFVRAGARAVTALEK